MKKLLTTLGTISTGLLLGAPQAFADAQGGGDLNPCAPGITGIAATLCNSQKASLGSILGFVITIMFIIAVLIALAFLILGGIKWITSGGDKGGVENARNQIIAAVVGLIIVFLSFFILNLVLGAFGLSLFDLKLPTLPKG